MSTLHPTAVVTTRREPVHNPAHFPIFQQSVAPGVAVTVAPQSRPLPVEQSAFWGVGRTFDHAWPHQRVQQQLAISEWQYPGGGMLANFLPGMKAAPGALIAFQSVGGQNAIGQRVNVNPPRQVKLSDQTQIAPVQILPLNPAYLKLA
jgi:hypothetical protein